MNRATLSYRSVRPVDAAVGDQLTRQAAEITQQHDWWSGPLTFSPAKPDGHLEGQTELTLASYETSEGERIEVAEDDDAFMSWMDLCVIVDWLCERSEEHQLDWDLTYAGEPAGDIRQGDEDEDLAVFVAELGSVVGASFDERDDDRANRLDDAHSARLKR